MLKVFSFGGGVQSMACLVLAAQGRIDYQTFLFCNVGDDSEHPDTLRYVRDVAMPYAQANNITLEEICYTRRNGDTETIYQRLTRPGSRSIGIPVRMNTSGTPGRRSCTYDFKIAVVDRWLKEHTMIKAMEANREEALLYAESPEHARRTKRFYAPDEIVAQVGIGISWDERQRMKSNVDPDTIRWKENVFPLLQEVPTPLTRQDCIRVIELAGLPVPPKSACWFCPFHTMSRWQEMRIYEPALFWQSVDLERLINEKRKAYGHDPVWSSGALKPLDQATTDMKQGVLFELEDNMCESGYCFV